MKKPLKATKSQENLPSQSRSPDSSTSDPQIVSEIKLALKEVAQPEKVADYQRFFKTKPGDYGEGDVFIGVKVPAQRQVAKLFRRLVTLNDALALLSSPIHEHRLTALFLMIDLYKDAVKSGNERLSSQIYQEYVGHIGRGINNWDLVDISAGHIVGSWLKDKNRRPLYNLARSDGLWHRRVAIIATSHFIRDGEFKDTLKIAQMLLEDKHDLIHKAVGWMLREVGKRDVKTLRGFLDKELAGMPRTTLRYAIERLPADERQAYLRAK